MSHKPHSTHERGQDMAEYALLLALIALFVLAAVSVIGLQLESVFSAINQVLAF